MTTDRTINSKNVDHDVTLSKYFEFSYLPVHIPIKRKCYPPLENMFTMCISNVDSKDLFFACLNFMFAFLLIFFFFFYSFDLVVFVRFIIVCT